MIAKEDVIKNVDKVFPAIFDAATKWKPEPPKDIVQAAPYPAKRMTFTGSYVELNKLFRDRKWSLSLPIIPPTPDMVDQMLKGTTRKPDEVLWVVPPRLGILTVELVATLGAMAGCTPDQMPLLLAIVEGMKDPNMGWPAVTTATGPVIPVVLVSGPAVQKLNIGFGTGAAGAEQPASNAIGYFVNLVGDVFGCSIPPNYDKSSTGSPGDLVCWVLGENAAENPWKQTYAEEQGFKATDSVVTVFSAMIGNSNGDHWSDSGTKVLNTLAVAAAGSVGGFGGCLEEFTGEPGAFGTSQHIFIVFGPEHANSIIKDFPSKEAVKEYLVKKIARPFSGYGTGLCTPPKEFGPVTDDTLIPRFTSTKSINMAVSGGAGKWTLIFSPFLSNLKPTSVLVKE